MTTWPLATWKFVTQLLVTASPGAGVQPPPAASVLLTGPVSALTGGVLPFELVSPVALAWFEAGWSVELKVALLPEVMAQSPDSGTPPNIFEVPLASSPQL